MAEQLGRNSPCWCGSGKKYKFCHWKRERKPPVTEPETKQVFKQAYGRKYCLHAEADDVTCRGKIIKAHTIQRNGGLSRIARNGLVYNFTPEIVVSQLPDEPTNPKLIGIKVASTFTGFCGFHDQSAFSSIETRSFTIDAKNAFLFGYRGICKELFAKNAAVEITGFMRSLDSGKPLDEQIRIQAFTRDFHSGEEAGLRDYQFHKTAFDAVLISQSFSDVRYYAIVFGNTPDLLCSGAIYPEYNFRGDALQDLSDLNKTLDILSYSLITTNNGGAAIFCWVGDSAICQNFVTSLHAMSDSDVSHALVRFTFDQFENLFIRPDWWENLAISEKRILSRRVLHGLPFDFHFGTGINPKEYFYDDGLRLVNWQVTERLTNLSF